MDARHHDRVLAITSHVPHLIAYTIVGTASDLENQLRRETAQNGDLVETAEVIKYSAGGFRDFTRIAASDPVMRSEEHTSELQSLMRISYAVFCLKKKTHLHILCDTPNSHTPPLTHRGLTIMTHCSNI